MTCKSKKKEELDRNGKPRFFSYMSERINEIIHVVNDADLHPALDFDDVLMKFKINVNQPIDVFCEEYLRDNYINKKYDPSQFVNTVHQLRRFLFDLEREGDLRS